MQTIKSLLETLPEPYKSKALGNIKESETNNKCVSLFAALNSFVWEDTKEGAEYWDTVYNYHWELDCAHSEDKQFQNNCFTDNIDKKI